MYVSYDTISVMCVCVRLFMDFCVGFAAFSISSENSQVVMIAISAAVAIILLTVVVYILIGRWVWCLICTFSPISMSQRGPDDRGTLGVVVWLVFNPLSAAQELQTLPHSQ